jgi:ATP-dependent 26S proteasome regulatory subunit
MRTHEASSTSLKNCEYNVRDWIEILKILTESVVRFSLKDLEKEFEKTEEDIKAVQSVGQIIGEVMKQLDDERCTYFLNSYLFYTLQLMLSLFSHCEGLFRTSICSFISPYTTNS